MRTAGLDSSALITGLHPSTKYHVTVRAYNRAGTGPASPSANATTMKPRESGTLGAGGAGGSRITFLERRGSSPQGRLSDGKKGVGFAASAAPLFSSVCWSLFLSSGNNVPGTAVMGRLSRKWPAENKGVRGGETSGTLLLTLPALAAPRRPPGNISWTFSSSSLSIKWDPVVPLSNESAVTGYKVRRAVNAGGQLVCAP